MKTIILAVALILGFSPNVWAAVQTDTHTYIVSEYDNAVLAINRQTGEEKTIRVGSGPKSMVIHGGMGYVMNYRSNNVSVIDLKTNAVTQTISVGEFPRSMVIQGDKGYVMNDDQNTVSVLDLKRDEEIKKINVGSFPTTMVTHGEKGYVVNTGSNTVSVLNFKRDEVIQDIQVGQHPQFIVIHGEEAYVVNGYSNTVSVLDLKRDEVIREIQVGGAPTCMVIHGEEGYVVNYGSNDVSVIDLKTNTVTQTISVERTPVSMVIYGELGYVINSHSHNLSVINLKTNALINTIRVPKQPVSMVIHKDIGYLKHHFPAIYTVINLKTNHVITTFKNPERNTIDFSDTHVYLGLKKARPLYPTLATINRAKAEKTLGEFVAMMPEVFQLGEIEPRLLPKEKNEFDTLPTFFLAQSMFWDVDTDKPLMDPQDILATLVTMQSPQKFLIGDAGAWLRKRLHMAFFQAVWLGDKGKTKAMLTYFVQLQDPVITKLATYTFKDAKESSDQKATNSTDLN